MGTFNELLLMNNVILIMIVLITICVIGFIGFKVITGDLDFGKILYPMVGFAVFVFTCWTFFDSSQKYNQNVLSEKELLAQKMQRDECKQTSYTQGTKTSGSGFGVTMKGDLALGSVSTTQEDQYVYSCKEGKTYTTNFDLDEYNYLKEGK